MISLVAAILANLTFGGLAAAAIEGGVGQIGSYGVRQALGGDQPATVVYRTVVIERHYYHCRKRIRH